MFLSADEIDQVIEASISAGIVSDATRRLLMDAIPPSYWHQLCQLDSPAHQMRSDLNELNRTPSLIGESEPPLFVWLMNAAKISSPRLESKTFLALAQKVIAPLGQSVNLTQQSVVPVASQESAAHGHVQRRRALISTALGVEYAAVRRLLSDLREEVHPLGTVYEIGNFSSAAINWDVYILETGAGNVWAALEVERAIGYLVPEVALFVGVAGGIKDVGVGDVVVANKIYSYESGKEEAKFHPRPEVSMPSHRLVQRARAEARSGAWRRLSKVEVGASCRVVVGAIAAGEKVIASKRSAVYRFLVNSYGDAIAVEMEGRGFLQAAHAHPNILSLVIRGISDLIDGKGAADRAGCQSVAASHAAAFAFQVLSHLQV